MEPQQDLRSPEFFEVGLSSWERPPHDMPRPHRHNEIEFIYAKSGQATYLFGPNRVTLKPRTLNLFWSGIPHQIVQASQACVLIGFEIPLYSVLNWKLPDRLIQPLMNGRMLMESDPAVGRSDGAMASRWHQDLVSGSASLRRAVLLEVQARLWRFANTNGVSLEGPWTRSKSRLERMVMGEHEFNRSARMIQFVAENYVRPIRVEDIARVLDLHPDYAMKIFHKITGISLADYVTQHRIAHAKRLLAGPSRAKIMDIALESGFGSLNRFNASFKEACGVSPKAFRKSRAVAPAF